MKKRTLLLGAAVIVLTGGTAGAADMAVKSARVAPVVAPVFSWTGCYLGVHGGGGAVRSDFTDAFTSEGRGGTSSWGNGGLAGGQIGCNYQTGVLVFGVEGEGYWSGLKARQQTVNSFFDGGGTRTITDTAEVRNKWDATVAGRIGVAHERAFIYGKAGWAWGRHDFNFTHTDVEGPSSFFFQSTGNTTLNGPLFGVGVEYALTNNWTVKGEYNYINYGLSPVSLTQTERSCFNSSCDTNVSTGFSQTFSAEKHIFKFGVNYLFPVGGAAVVAKY